MTNYLAVDAAFKLFLIFTSGIKLLIYLQFAFFNDETPTDVDDPEPSDLLPQVTSFQRQEQSANPGIQPPPEQLFTPSQTHIPKKETEKEFMESRRRIWRRCR